MPPKTSFFLENNFKAIIMIQIKVYNESVIFLKYPIKSNCKNMVFIFLHIKQIGIKISQKNDHTVICLVIFFIVTKV